MNINLDDIKSSLEEVSFEDDSNELGQRLAEIRLELKAKGISKTDIIETIGVSDNLLWRAEKGNGISSLSFLKLINLYQLLGYNPLWILTKNNLFINKYEIESDIILNRTSVSSASEDLIESLEEQMDNINKAIKEFKKNIKG